MLSQRPTSTYSQTLESSELFGDASPGTSHFTASELDVESPIDRQLSHLPSSHVPLNDKDRSRAPPPTLPLPLLPTSRAANQPEPPASPLAHSPPAPPPPARSPFRPRPPDDRAQLLRSVQQQRLSRVEFLARTGLAAEQLRQANRGQQHHHHLNIHHRQHLRSPSAPEYRSPPTPDGRRSPSDLSAYSGTSSAVQKAIVARRPDRPHSARLHPDSALYIANSALYNALTLPQRASQRFVRTPAAWNAHARLDYDSRHLSHVSDRSARVVQFESPLRSPVEKQTQRLRPSRRGPSKSVPRSITKGKAPESGLSPQLLQAYFGSHARFRDISMENHPEPTPPRPTHSAKSHSQSFTDNTDLERGLSNVPQSFSQQESYGEEEDDSSWGPQHPCFPHLNPHIPTTSPLYASTRIIRIKRDWMIAGDLAPTFSNLYPEVLDTFVSEDEFRDLIRGVNDRLIEAHNSFSWINILDVVLAVLTFWLWDDFGFTAVKRRLRALELWLQEWNTLKSKQAAAGSGKEAGLELVKVWDLRRTGYLSIDIQIPDPKLPMYADRPETGDA